MFDWLVGALLSLAGGITSWFIARDASNFTVIQGMVALLLSALFVAIAAFSPLLMRRLGVRRSSNGR